MTTTPAAAPETRFAAIRGLREDFPGLAQTVNERPLVYLDSAASAQCPQAVIDAICEQQAMNHANVHRGVHVLSERATTAYESARERVARYLNAASPEEIVFTRGTTESINLVAASLGQLLLDERSEVLITHMEHHSNIVPWQLICERTGARLRVAPVDDTGQIDMAAFRDLLSERTRIAAFTHVSNALGTVNPVRELTAAAHEAGACVLVDGAQAMAHQRVDVTAIDCDFYAFSGHKMFAGTGIGALYGKSAWLDRMPPYQGGGEMILTVTFDSTTYNALPYKFEAGTPNITGAVALRAAIDYLEAIDFAALHEFEAGLLHYATARLEELPGLRIIGNAPEKAGAISFVMDGIHAHDLGTIVDAEGVAIRTGHHCTMPLMERFGLAATARASFALYNNESDVDALVRGLRNALELFA
jgi:cysteine desulfurase/selenocysteine lyase